MSVCAYMYIIADVCLLLDSCRSMCKHFFFSAQTIQFKFDARKFKFASADPSAPTSIPTATALAEGAPWSAKSIKKAHLPPHLFQVPTIFTRHPLLHAKALKNYRVELLFKHSKDNFSLVKEWRWRFQIGNSKFAKSSA